MKKVTIYQSSTFGIARYEGLLLEIGTKEYAQYKDALFVHFIPKGKRKAMGLLATYQPYIVVMEGHDHPKPDNCFTAPVLTESGLTTTQSRFSCFDENYKTEFDAKISEYMKDKTILVDVRNTVNTNLITKTPRAI